MEVFKIGKTEIIHGALFDIFHDPVLFPVWSGFEPQTFRAPSNDRTSVPLSLEARAAKNELITNPMLYNM